MASPSDILTTLQQGVIALGKLYGVKVDSTRVTTSATGATHAVAVNGGLFFNGVGILVTVPSGTTVNYTVQVSGDPANTVPSNWNDHDDLVGKTTSANGNIVFPVTWVRLYVTSISGGSVTMNVVQ